MVKNLPAMQVMCARDTDLTGKIPWESRQSTQHSCLENPMDKVAWQASVHVVTESDMT